MENSNCTSAQKIPTIPWPRKPSTKQVYSFPDPLVYYMAIKPLTAKCYSKMVQSCKYFFEKNPILIAEDNIKIFEESVLCSYPEKFQEKRKCSVRIELYKIISKIWFKNSIVIFSNSMSNFITKHQSRFYGFEIDVLAAYHRDVAFDSFKFMASLVKHVSIYECTMTDNTGNAVSLDEILEAIPNIWILEHSDFSTATSSTMKNIAKFKRFKNFAELELLQIPEIFSVDDFSELVKNLKDTKITLQFSDNISEQYKNQLIAFIGKIAEADCNNCVIKYKGQSAAKLKIMESRCYISYNMSEVD